MKKHIIAAIVLVCLIVPAQAAFARDRNHHDDLLVQLIEMSIFPHRYLIPAVKPHRVHDRYHQNDNRRRNDNHYYNDRHDRRDHNSYRRHNRHDRRDSYHHNDRRHDHHRDYKRNHRRNDHRGHWE